MGYKKIPNLYQEPEVIFLFKEAYYLEKLHGTSAHFRWKDGKLTFFSGGEKHDKFVSIFDVDALTKALTTEFGLYVDVTVYGEAYGGKQQGMSATYGKELKFTAFEVKIDDNWLNVPNAHDVANKLEIEFVHYVQGPTSLEFANEQRDAPSVQSVRNGIEEPKKREGVVIRPLVELTKNNGERMMAKHKHDDFQETKTPRVVTPEKLQMMEDAKEIAEEWVTEMRLTHVIDKLSLNGKEVTIKDTKLVIDAMIKDVGEESKGEIKWGPEVYKALGRGSAVLFKNRLKRRLSVKDSEL
jgi:hypothetical protein